MKKIIKLLLFSLSVMVCWLAPVRNGAASQYFATRYAFTDRGQLQTPLLVKFSEAEQKKVKAIITHMDTNDRTLLIACSEGEDVFLADFNKAYEYAIYKINFRDKKEDLLILGYGQRGTGKTTLCSLDVIGLDNSGNISI